MEDMDFIGFTYNGIHSYRDLGIYRTSDGSRYNENLTATMTDKTADVPGGDGQYYFGTTFKNRTFTVNYAFDNLSEAGIRSIKNLFCGADIHDLVFDEVPYKVWSAKVTGTATLKHLAFEEDGKRVYKGEGSVTFTCYYPYARTPDKLWTCTNKIWKYSEADGKKLSNYSNAAYPNKQLWKDASGLNDSISVIKGDKAISPICEINYSDNPGASAYINKLFIVYSDSQGGTQLEHSVELDKVPVKKGDLIHWDTKTGIIYQINKDGEKTLLPYTGNGVLLFSPGNSLVKIDTYGSGSAGTGRGYPRGATTKLKYNYLYR